MKWGAWGDGPRQQQESNTTPCSQGSESHGEGRYHLRLLRLGHVQLIPVLSSELTFAATSSRNAVTLFSLPDSTAPSVVWTRSVLQVAERVGSSCGSQEETQPLRKRQRPKEPCRDAEKPRCGKREALWETKKGQERRERQIGQEGQAPREPEGASRQGGRRRADGAN